MSAPVQIMLPNKTKQLALIGNCSYNLDGDGIYLKIEEIANSRMQHTVSGALSLELWALPAPYAGGDFTGQPLASSSLGVLNGQQNLHNWEHNQPLQMPGEGLWYLTLMLREWENGGFVTRDYINFPDPVKAEYKLTLSLA